MANEQLGKQCRNFILITKTLSTMGMIKATDLAAVFAGGRHFQIDGLRGRKRSICDAKNATTKSIIQFRHCLMFLLKTVLKKPPKMKRLTDMCKVN